MEQIRILMVNLINGDHVNGMIQILDGNPKLSNWLENFVNFKFEAEKFARLN